MKQDIYLVLVEIRDMLKGLSQEQQQLIETIQELKEEHEKLKEEVKLNNFVLSNISFKDGLIN